MKLTSPASPAALLAIPLATTFASAPTADAEPITYDLTINPTLRLLESYLFVASTSPIIDIARLGGFDGGSSNQITFTDTDDFADENVVVFLGVYEEDDEAELFNPGLSVSLLDQGSNTQTNPTFAGLFGDLFSNPEGAEDPIVQDLLSGNVDEFGEAAAFVQGFAFPRFNSVFPTGNSPITGFDDTGVVSLANFTELTDGGTIEVTSVRVIPEPASLALLGFGGLLLAARRRR